MMEQDVYITNIAAFLPNAAVDNDSMERLLGQAGGQPSRARKIILRSNGIQCRHYAIDPDTLKPSHTNAQLTAEAIRRLPNADFKIDDITLLACGTSTPDQIVPNHAVMVQGELRLPVCEAVATSGICLSGMTALKYAWHAVVSGSHSTAVATGSEIASAAMRSINFEAELNAKVEELGVRPELAFEKDFLRWMLSDGAGAVLLKSKPGSKGISLRIDWIEAFSFAGQMDACMYAGANKNGDGSLTGWRAMDPSERNRTSVMSLKQDVRLLNENIIHYTVERPLPGLVQKYQLRPEHIDYFLPHYSSLYFRDRVHDGMIRAGFDVPQDRWFTNLPSKGNIGSASIYIMLEEILSSGKVKKGQRLLCYIPESGRFSTCFMHLTAVAADDR